MVYVKVNSDGNDMTQVNLKQTYSIKTKIIEHHLYKKNIILKCLWKSEKMS